MKAGDLVEVRSREEILASLGPDGTLERMPFMPEMLRHCGKRYRVSAVAHKTCDSAFKTGGRRLLDTVHLEELRCDGSAHAGCQATCLIFWKTAWLRKVDASAERSPEAAPSARAPALSVEALQAGTSRVDAATGKTLYFCQVTQLYHATTLQPWWDFRQFWRDITCGNSTIRRALRVLTLASLRAIANTGIAYRITFWIYDRVHRALNGFPAPRGAGTVKKGGVTPEGHLDLQTGETVRVKSHEEIKQTLNAAGKNRGMWFDHEMVKFCGHRYRVSGRVHNIIDEVSGEMLRMKQPCIVLDGVYCTAEYTPGRLLCRRAVTTYWRENWLERDQPAEAGARAAPAEEPRTTAMNSHTRLR